MKEEILGDSTPTIEEEAKLSVHNVLETKVKEDSTDCFVDSVRTSPLCLWLAAERIGESF